MGPAAGSQSPPGPGGLSTAYYRGGLTQRERLPLARVLLQHNVSPGRFQRCPILVDGEQHPLVAAERAAFAREVEDRRLRQAEVGPEGAQVAMDADVLVPPDAPMLGAVAGPRTRGDLLREPVRDGVHHL